MAVLSIHRKGVHLQFQGLWFGAYLGGVWDLIRACLGVDRDIMEFIQTQQEMV